MVDLLEIYSELRTIRSRIESLEQGQEILIRAERDRIEAVLVPLFEDDLALGRVFLLVDGVRGQREISRVLTAEGISGASESSVSRKLDALRELDLVERVDRTQAGNIYRKSALDRILRLSRRIQRMVETAS